MPGILGRSRRVLAIFAFVTLFMGMLPIRAQAGGCRIVMSETHCDACKNVCCNDFNAHMSSCRLVRLLCYLVLDFQCEGYRLCVMEAEHDLEICNWMCEIEYQDCE